MTARRRRVFLFLAGTLLGMLAQSGLDHLRGYTLVLDVPLLPVILGCPSR